MNLRRNGFEQTGSSADVLHGYTWQRVKWYWEGKELASGSMTCNSEGEYGECVDLRSRVTHTNTHLDLLVGAANNHLRVDH